MTIHPQLRAANPRTSAFVAANAGSGKTKTLVERVARLLLHGARPEAILCVTYTKAAAAEMQRRLYDTLGGWSVMADATLAQKLVDLGEQPGDLAVARRLFARALETPGGLKIQTLHAFCEKLLRRFPLEAGVSPSFRVMEDAAAAEVSAGARDALALFASAHPDGAIAAAYAHFAVELDIGAFEGLLKTFETERAAIEGYLEAHGGLDGAADDVWRVCGFDDEPTDPEALEEAAVAACDWAQWRGAVGHLLASSKSTDLSLGQAMAALAEVEGGAFADIWRLFSTDKGEPRAKMGTASLPTPVLDFLKAEQTRLHEACKRAKAAHVARDTVRALTLAHAYATLYAGEKARRGALDFPDLIARTRDLLTERADAAWVLYKLDGGIDHVLLDEAQDTSPQQWEILEALTAEFFAGEGGRATTAQQAVIRTLFAVGDAKQSIYSFQGADPGQLLVQTRAYIDRTAEGGFDFEVVPLLESWRSTPEVLGFVDAVFADAATHNAVQPPEGEDVISHLAVRGPGYGSVDLWPPFQDAPAEPSEAWDAPLDATSPETARKQLARRIAEAVRAITSSQAVVAKGDPTKPTLRPATAGDVLILVRRRDALFEEIIRALKKAGLPVAGADRLKLSDHVVFQDILSLCRFCLFPADDLTVAELLRSPFCDVDEQSLYDLAYGRQGSLWAALGRRAQERADWREAHAFLDWARRAAQRRTPFDFLGRVMSQLDPAGRSMRQRILTRLGREAEDALDEVMAQTLAAEGRGVHDLERLTAALERADIQVKRELDTDEGGAGGEVRVMTVHGAKGLEAPIVILPDTTAKPPPSRGAFLKTEAGGFLFAPRKGDDCEASAAARLRIEERTAEEQLRLLYVALTRARDRVIITGRLSARDKAPPPASWYARIETAFARPEIADATREIEADGLIKDWAIRRYGADPQPAPAPEAAGVAPAGAPPAWLRAFATTEAVQRYASPSTYAEGQRGAAPSPLAQTAGLGRFRRGDIIHRLLQILPDLQPHARALGAGRLLAKERDLSDDQRAEMADAALGVLNDPRFAEVFGDGSRAEAAVAGSAPGLPARLAISGRVDRMVVTPDRVLVVDFKSNRPSPDRIEEADEAYLAQMAIYVAVLRAVFPGRRVEAALVWTDGPKLMPVPENLIEATLVRLRESD
jgi:ATP-dependent helicase/nuclease subunit A